MATRMIDVAGVEQAAYWLAKQTMDWGERIPDLATRYPNVLERTVAAPFKTFDSKALYPGLLKQTAILFYLMIKNHPFQNGNKRIAMTTTFYFLEKNGKWLQVDNQELYNFAKWVAESNPKLKDATVSAIETFFAEYLVAARP